MARLCMPLPCGARSSRMTGSRRLPPVHFAAWKTQFRAPPAVFWLTNFNHLFMLALDPVACNCPWPSVYDQANTAVVSSRISDAG